VNWVDALFRPRSVAVVGSVSPGKIGRVLVDQLLAGGYAEVVAVNPRAEGAGRVAAAHSLHEIDARIDLAVVASPAATVPDVLEDAGKAGVKVAVVITAGFAEADNTAGELEILAVARRWGLRVVGPNCAGIVNTKHDLYPTLETRPPIGDAAFVSQSGALGGAVLSWAEEQGVGFSKFVSYGNGVDLTDVDFLDALRDDEETRVVALYVETVSNGRRFMGAARRLAAVKPLLVIKSGRSDSGRRATISHTGSMAGADAVFDAALRQSEAIRVDGIEEMFDLCRGFTTLPPVKGRRLAIVTNSGGPGVLAADRAEASGLRVEPPSEGLRDRLKRTLEPFCGLDNPFDLTVQGTEDDYRDVLVEVLAEYDAAVAINVNTPYLDSAPLAAGVVAAAKSTDKPIAASFMAGRPAQAALPVLRKGGVPNFATGERAVRVLALITERERVAEATTASAAGSDRATPPREPESLPWDRDPLEPEAMDWLKKLGFPVVDLRWARTVDEAADAVLGFAGPVAMKVVSPSIVHKSDAGGVILNVDGPEEAVAAFERLGVLAGDDFRGVLVSPMVSESVEVLVGLSRDPQFGPVVACGLGGIFTEVLDDVALRVAPVELEEARAMLAELRGSAILRGARGRAPRDLDALAELLTEVSGLPFRFPTIAELDLNPVFSLERGARIGDVRVVLLRDEEKP
jgi:acyl-CoA synthetase (NDP forming)